MTTLAIYSGSIDDTFNFGTSVPSCQAFKVPANSIISSVAIIGSRGISSSGTFKIEIYETGSNPENGILKYTQTFNSNVLPVYTASPTMQIINLSSPTPTLTGGSTQYYINITPLTGSASDELRWSNDNSSPAYPDGKMWYKSAGVWYEASNTDHNFAIYGTIAPTTNIKKLNSANQAVLKKVDILAIASTKKINYVS